MRVLAVLELEDLLVVAHHVVGEVAFGLAEPVGDDEVVVRRAVEGLGGKLTERLVAELTRRRELVEQVGVVLVAGDHRDAGVVLGRGADHARPADVDVLDDDLVLDAAPLRDLLERVEAADHHVDGFDVVLLDGLHVLGHVAAGEDACHEPRVHGLDAAVEHLGEAGDLFDQGDRDAGILEQLGGPAGGDDGDAHVGETLGERLDATLVEDGDKCSLDLHCHAPSVDCPGRVGAGSAPPHSPRRKPTRKGVRAECHKRQEAVRRSARQPPAARPRRRRGRSTLRRGRSRCRPPASASRRSSARRSGRGAS